MKIKEIKIWKNGQFEMANDIDVKIISDNLESECTFYYELKKIVPKVENEITIDLVLAYGNVILNGDEYLDWTGTNQYAYNFVATELNIELWN